MARTEEAIRDLQQRLLAVRDGVSCLASAIAEQPGINATKLRADVWLAMDRLHKRRGSPHAQEFVALIVRAIEAGSPPANPGPAPGTPPPPS